MDDNLKAGRETRRSSRIPSATWQTYRTEVALLVSLIGASFHFHFQKLQRCSVLLVLCTSTLCETERKRGGGRLTERERPSAELHV